MKTRSVLRPHRDSVARRLGIAFGVLTALIALVGAGAVTGAVMENTVQDRIADRLQPAWAANMRLHNEAVRLQRSVRGYLLLGDRDLLEDYRQARDRYPGLLDAVRRHATPGVDGNLDSQQRQLAAYVQIADRQAKASPRSEQAVKLARTGSAAFERFADTNQQLQAQLGSEIQRLQDRSDTLVTAGTAALAALVAAALLLSLYTARRITRSVVHPLRQVQQALGRLTAGEHSTRVRPQGPHELRAVAESVNQLADESDRLRRIEQDRSRLGEIARQTGVRIRERLDVEDVLDNVCAGMGEGLDADYVFLLLRDGDSPLVPVARAWSAERGILDTDEQQALPGIPAEVVRDHYRRGTTWVVPDLSGYLTDTRPVPGAPGSFGDIGLPEANRAASARLGLHAVAVVPLGVADEPLGAICLARTRPERPWESVEIETAESMAGGVARALHTSMLYENETRLVEELRALDRAKSDFLSTVSHELRTPLTSIVGYIELLKDEDTGPLTEPQHKMLDVVARNAHRLRTLIEDLLTLSRIESGKYTSRKKPVDLCHLVASAVDAIRPAADAASVHLHADCPGRPLVCEADSDQLDRVLMNLLSNAVKFTPQDGQVRVRAAQQDGHAVISVSDTGIGIPAPEQKQLFTRFFRASNANEAAIPGTGLGLTIVRTIIDNHGGTTELHSREGQGTTVTARLPLSATDQTTADTTTH
ncbi:ATP-binding protein [Streptomyces sp. DH10]|uniref:ATP-binding protein n=1 Tax=Streptomyces sp. DH10 TaxID=3040121 RepID=UPI002441323F|nr:ATP-binding protein [Streptomyces sp. DH10]MDG9710624.1 ATP-binding protein [Streptomyces sp. DH10]